jgi:transcriptional regulator NrdR family protein
VIKTKARGAVIERVRQCAECKAKFTTWETSEKALPVSALNTGIQSLLNEIESNPLFHLKRV